MKNTTVAGGCKRSTPRTAVLRTMRLPGDPRRDMDGNRVTRGKGEVGGETESEPCQGSWRRARWQRRRRRGCAAALPGATRREDE
eukprot:7916137-Alexandrium_andersonii.AAC.1